MPWRKNTLTRFRSPGSVHSVEASADAASEVSCGYSMSEPIPSELFGETGGNLEATMLDAVLDEEPEEGPLNSVTDLGASTVPRRPTLADDSFSQMLASSFIRNRKRPAVLMPWDKGVAKKIFSKASVVPEPLAAISADWVSVETSLVPPSEVEADLSAEPMHEVGRPVLKKPWRWREVSLQKPDSAPVLEEDAWAYLNSLQELRAAPTRGSSFISACNYARFIFGFDTLTLLCNSRRLRGLADVMYVKKAPLKQAKVLTVEQVHWIHEQLRPKETHPIDRAIFGYVVTALYGRCRQSDLALVNKILLDFDETGGEIIHAIHMKRFMPDSLRSKYFAPEPEQAADVQEVKSELGDWSLVGKSENPDTIDLDGDVIFLPSSDDESVSSVESSDSDAMAGSLPMSTRHLLSKATASFFTRHKTSKLAHYKDVEPGRDIARCCHVEGP
eukprot:s444_g43.t1